MTSYDLTVLNQLNFCMMSNSSIFEKAWLDLVFEGKNQTYGAYQLRKDSAKTTLYAFALGLFFVASVISAGLFLSSFGNKPTMNDTPVLDDTLHVTRWDNMEPPVVPPPPPAPKNSEPATTTTDTQEMTNNPEIVASNEADDVKRNDDPPTAPEGPKGPDGGTTAPSSTGTPGTGTEPSPAPPAVPNGPMAVTMLDKMPEFPGGIKKFYEYVGNNFEKPEIDQTVNVLMSFVIEKDGTMTDIKVLRNPGYGLDKEAIRVLKSLRTKWEPGIKNGQPVRVLYQLPIKVTRTP